MPRHQLLPNLDAPGRCVNFDLGTVPQWVPSVTTNTLYKHKLVVPMLPLCYHAGAVPTDLAFLRVQFSYGVAKYRCPVFISELYQIILKWDWYKLLG